MKQLKDCTSYLNDFYSVCREGLKQKLGPVLFQFPPRFIFTEERSLQITSSLDTSFINVVEFRHASWWNKKVFTALKKHGIIFCGISYPGLPDEVIITGKTAYYRFHGVPKLYYSPYDEIILQKIADSLLKQKTIKNVYCYFNNTAAVGAIYNAVWLEKYTAASPEK